jgi:G:T/U-mismatch repair DNA glycosylase
MLLRSAWLRHDPRDLASESSRRLHSPFGKPDNEQFWRELNAAIAATVVFRPRSIKVLIDLYRDDDAYKLADRTKEATTCI